MNKYIIYFDFSTIHGKGRIAGRSGSLSVSTNIPFKQFKKEPLETICREHIIEQKPKWKVFSITITNIEEQKTQLC